MGFGVGHQDAGELMVRLIDNLDPMSTNLYFFFFFFLYSFFVCLKQTLERKEKEEIKKIQRSETVGVDRWTQSRVTALEEETTEIYEKTTKEIVATLHVI